MAKSKQALKSRIRSIKATMKITSAMELIANAKLAKSRSIMESNYEYANILQMMTNEVLASIDNPDSSFLKEHKSPKAFTVVFCSDLGLCGGYNANILKMALNNLNKEDPLVVFGTKLYPSFKKAGFNIYNQETPIDSLSYNDIQKVMNEAIDLYLNDEIGKIQILYTHFINTVSFNPTFNILAPYVASEKVKKQEIIFDPDNQDEVLDDLIKMMIHNVTYALSLESKTSEQASRRLAMENANDNAQELQDELTLAYNQARQAAITQEITEIVSGADAL